jgi:hypothetical protein
MVAQGRGSNNSIRKVMEACPIFHKNKRKADLFNRVTLTVVVNVTVSCSDV